MEKLIMEVLRAVITPSSVATLALLLVIFWMFKFIGKLVKADKKKTETLIELTVLLRLLVDGRRCANANVKDD